MIKKLFVVTALMALMLSACGGGTPVETATPEPTVTLVTAATQAPTSESPVTGGTEAVVETPTTSPDATFTPGVPRPTNQPGCTNSASFVADITIPDNSIIGAGETFTKTWRISNTGTCIWASDYKLVHYSDQRMGAPDGVPLDITYPGETLDISVELVAPNSPGTYRGNFVIENPEGLIMKIDEDSRLWLIINVTNTAVAPTATTTTSTSPTATNSTTGDNGLGTASCSFTTDRTKLTDTIKAINAYRAQSGLPAYTVNNLLARAAQAHANDMACNNLFVHTGSDGSTPESRVAATGYVAASMSENVYGSYPPLTGQGVVNWWATDKTDPRHNQNLLSNTFTEIGVGYAFFDNYGYYVLVFAKP
ncbi:MAG: hypothetical protein C3F07_21055 [Anaerolineales bacterium]|nr:MAG: hypothetical protein C3F07_21055 [Anaerolineales bacterium]